MNVAKVKKNCKPSPFFGDVSWKTWWKWGI